MSSKAEARAAIYNRLASAPTYHPASADLFTDWTLQGGDIVTVTSDEESYTLPIFGMNINWTGKTKVKVESSGNEMRDSIENMAQKQAAIRSNSYRRGRTVASGLNEIHHDMFDESGYLHASINATASEIRMDMQNAISGLQSSIVQTASAIYSSVSANNSQIYTFVEQTASGILSEIVDTETGLMNYINNTASGTRQIITNFTNKMWIQENDPTTAAGGSHTPKEGDMWVESTHQGSWDGAEGFDWEHDENFDWFQIQGAKIWGWANDKWELISDQQQTISYSELINTCDVFFSQKFKGIVNDEGMLEIYLSKLEQTAFEIKAEVSAANSTVYSYIHQTASNINMRVGETPRTVVAKTQPTSINNRGLKEGDVWVESEEQENWDKAEQYSWGDDSEVDWNQLRSDKIHVYHNGEWVEALDGTTLIDDADLEIERGTARLYARKLEMVDGQLQRYYAELKVDANQIKSQVNEYYNKLGSSITQTASQIRSDVFAANSKVYSYILQTASGIRTEVGNAISGVYSNIVQTADSISSYVYAAQSTIYSSIQQTASGIRSEVGDVVSGLQSTITQTASQIRSEVSNSISNVQSSITQNANAIGLVVEKKNGQNVIKSASILTAINADTSQIKISADKIILDGNTVAASLSGKEVYANAFGGDDLYVYSALHIEEDGDLYYGYGSSAYRYNFSDVIVDASVSGNTLTLTKADGTPVTFSKATSLSGAWSGRTFTVTAKQNNVQVNTYSGFVYDGIVPSGSTTLNGTSVEHDYIVYSDDGEGNADKQILKKKISISCSNYLVAKTENDKITANGTYTPGNGKLGFSSVEVDVSSSAAITEISGTPVGDVYEDTGDEVTITAKGTNVSDFTNTVELSVGSWRTSNPKVGNIAINVYLGNDRIIRKWIPLPDGGNWSKQYIQTGNQYKVTHTLKGKEYTWTFSA